MLKVTSDTVSKLQKSVFYVNQLTPKSFIKTFLTHQLQLNMCPPVKSVKNEIFLRNLLKDFVTFRFKIIVLRLIRNDIVLLLTGCEDDYRIPVKIVGTLLKDKTIGEIETSRKGHNRIKTLVACLLIRICGVIFHKFSRSKKFKVSQTISYCLGICDGRSWQLAQ